MCGLGQKNYSHDIIELSESARVTEVILVVTANTLYHRDDALLYIAYVMLIWAAPIPADRWHCSLWLWLTLWVDWHTP